MIFEFTVRGDRLVADKDYSFVEGNQNVYKAKFMLDDAWTDEFDIMCVVYSNDKKLVPVPVVHGECLLPKFAVGSAKIGLVGIMGEDDRETPIISTDWVKIGVDKGANNGVTAEDFNESVKAIWAQYYADMAECRDQAEGYARQAEVFDSNAKEAASNAKTSESNAKSFAEEAEGHANSAASNASDAQISAENAYNSEINAYSSKEAAESAAKSAYDHRENAKHWAATAMGEAASIKNMTVSATSGAYADVEKTETDDGIHLEFTLPKGEKGADGYTPVKGVDYFTPTDIEDLDIPRKEYIENIENDALSAKTESMANTAFRQETEPKIEALRKDVDGHQQWLESNDTKHVNFETEITNLKNQIGDIDEALEELHNYAQALIGGEA